MAEFQTRLFADARGVWQETSGRQPSGILWDEIYTVSGYKLDGITEIYTCVVLDWDYGEFFEMNHDWEGFDEVIAAITEHLPDIASDWFERIEALTLEDDSLTVWQRA